MNRSLSAVMKSGDDLNEDSNVDKDLKVSTLQRSATIE